jgi:hypothetical protein
MALAPIFQSLLDVLQGVSTHLSPKQAGMLSEVNRFCHAHIKPMDSRYHEIINACPWMSEPRRIASHCRSSGWDLRKMMWHIGDNCLIVTAKTHFQGMRKFTLPMYPEQEEDFESESFPLFDEEDVVISEVFQHTEQSELEPLIRNHAFTRPQPFQSVHSAPFNSKVTFYITRINGYIPYRTSALSIIDTTNKRLLRRIGGVTKCWPPVLFNNHEFWLVDDITGDINYYGPRVDKITNNNISGRIWSAKLMAAAGKINSAVRLLAKRGDSINTRFTHNETLLLAMAQEFARNKVHVLETPFLVFREQGADFNAEDDAGVSAVDWAIRYESVTVLRYLLKNGAAPRPGTFHRVLTESPAHNKYRVKMLDLLLQYGANINAGGDMPITPLMLATVHIHVPAVAYLLSKGADPHIVINGKTALDMISGPKAVGCSRIRNALTITSMLQKAIAPK